MDAGKNRVENIAAHIAGTGGDYCSVLGKKAINAGATSHISTVIRQPYTTEMVMASLST